MNSTMLYICVLIGMGILLLLWILVCAIQYYIQVKSETKNLSIPVSVTCCCCHQDFIANMEQFSKGKLVKTRSITKTKVHTGYLENQPKYVSYQKKFYCPNCQSNAYCEVNNIQDIQKETKPILLKRGIRILLIMAMGCGLIVCMTMIPLHYVNKIKENELQDLKEQQIEQFKDRYGE